MVQVDSTRRTADCRISWSECFLIGDKFAHFMPPMATSAVALWPRRLHCKFQRNSGIEAIQRPMSAAATDRTTNDLAAGKPRYRLTVNSYDRAASLLVSLLVMVAIVFVSLFIIFLFRTFTVQIEAKPFEVFEPGPAGDAPKGFADEPEPPGLEDAPELEEPMLQDTLTAISNAAATKVAMLSNEAFDAADRAGKGSGLGDVRNTGVGGGGGDDSPKEMKYEPASQADYEQMLDFFEVELGVIARDGKIYYAKNLASPNPTTRVGTRDDEDKLKRFYFISTGNPLRDMEVKIAQKAGIMKNGGLIVTFYPDQRKGELYGIERAAMNENNIKERSQVKKTVYRFFRVGAKYDFKVESQTYF